MARVMIDADSLEVRLTGLHQVWAFKRRITIPLACVRGATADPGIVREPKGIRAPGLHVPGIATIGTFHRDGARHFWDVSTGANAVVIELAEGPYDRLILDVQDPREVVDAVNRAASRAER